MNTQEIELTAAELGVNPESLSSLLGFLLSNLEANPTLQAWCLKRPDEFLTEGVKAWHRMHTEFLTELAAGTSERAKQMREQLAGQVWSQIRERAGLPLH